MPKLTEAEKADRFDQIVDAVSAISGHSNRERRSAWAKIRELVGVADSSCEDAAVEEAEGAGNGEENTAGLTRPAKQAGALKWREYALSVGLDIPEDADKAAIIAAVEEAEGAGNGEDQA